MKKVLYEQLLKVLAERGQTRPSLWTYVLVSLRMLQLVADWLRARWYLADMNKLGQIVIAKGALQVNQQGYASIGTRVRIWSTIAPTQFYVAPEARLTIGDGSFLNGCLIAAYQDIEIGKNAYIAPSAQISDSHAFGQRDAHAAEQLAPVRIEDDVWIATRAIILPGVHIGAGAVVGVGAVVTEDVPARTVVGGVPARVLRQL